MFSRKKTFEFNIAGRLFVHPLSPRDLVEAIRVDPSTAPLVVWFNGGPGGSSLAGFFTEHGPYRVTEGGDVLAYNEFSWNQYANVLYLEGPVGVGFSINKQEEITLDDESAAENNFFALHDFMTRVHHNYAQRDFYLTGQSYAGAYIPWLSRRLLRGIASGELQNKNFKGFAIGNPVFEEAARNVATAIAYLTYGLIPQKYSELLFESWQKILRGEELDMGILKEIAWMVRKTMQIFNGSVLYNIAEHCPAEVNTELFHRLEKGSSYLCNAASNVQLYLNRLDVQTSLHISDQSTGARRWEISNDDMNERYNRTYNMLPIYNDIIQEANDSFFRMLIYHGDVDAILPVTLTVQSTNKIAADNSLIDQEYKSVWHFFNDFAGVRSGFRSSSGNVSLDILTVRGAGHSVPTSLPDQAFQMIYNFILTKEDEVIDYSKPIMKH